MYSKNKLVLWLIAIKSSSLVKFQTLQNIILTCGVVVRHFTSIERPCLLQPTCTCVCKLCCILNTHNTEKRIVRITS